MLHHTVRHPLVSYTQSLQTAESQTCCVVPSAAPTLLHSLQAVGEPPFHLGAAVFFALKDAVYAARADAGLTGGSAVMRLPN